MTSEPPWHEEQIAFRDKRFITEHWFRTKIQRSSNLNIKDLFELIILFARNEMQFNIKDLENSQNDIFKTVIDAGFRALCIDDLDTARDTFNKYNLNLCHYVQE